MASMCWRFRVSSGNSNNVDQREHAIEKLRDRDQKIRDALLALGSRDSSARTWFSTVAVRSEASPHHFGERTLCSGSFFRPQT